MHSFAKDLCDCPALKETALPHSCPCQHAQIPATSWEGTTLTITFLNVASSPYRNSTVSIIGSQKRFMLKKEIFLDQVKYRQIRCFSFSLHSNLSLASEDADSPESVLTWTSGSLSDCSRTRTFYNRRSPEKSLLRQPSQQTLHEGVLSSPASLSGSLTDIPVLLVNGVPQPDLQIQSPGPENNLIQTNSVPKPKPFPLHSKSKKYFTPKASRHAGTLYGHADIFILL